MLKQKAGAMDVNACERLLLWMAADRLRGGGQPQPNAVVMESRAAIRRR